ncbi:MAG TPA: hypothetical protein DDY21_04350 [Candidatus Moranbacteria bacterium]|nr:hypothetical protein [Candidatus Moranbacteria bacterium]HCO99428.1 hypothetical protein [Candidatus Moranbacteria bacterium]
MKTKSYILLAIVIAIFVIAGFLYVKKANAPVNNSQPTTENAQQEIYNNQIQTPVQPIQPEKQKAIVHTVDPLDNALARITKKPFGIYVAPKNSPVSPERFTGYHSAVDLEATIEEQNIDVAVKALCDGKLLVIRTASGYGGVAVQSCTLDGQAVTVIYGHIRLSSMTAKVGDQLKAGDFLANLGTGFSSETDGERKHLHLGIHSGNGMNILGYVQNKNQLNDWIDPVKYLN